ncbi:MAG: anti-sigma factor [Acidobacteriaceae bacterium]
MSATGHIQHDDLALYAMQLLDIEEHHALQSHLAACTECRKQLAQITGDLATVALTAEMHSPPVQARERLMSQVTRERKAVPFKSTEDSAETLLETTKQKRGPIAILVPYVGWAAAAAMAFVTVGEYNQSLDLRKLLDQRNDQLVHLTAQADRAQQILDLLSDTSATKVALTKTGAPPQPTGRATYLPERGSLIFIAGNMEPLPPFKTYELWVIPSDGRNPIPAGTFIPDAKGNASVVMPSIPKGVPAKAFGVTIEEAGGSQTPTMPIIMSGS